MSAPGNGPDPGARPYAAEIRRRLEAIPFSLDIYITDACNMNCGYCSSRRFIDGAGFKPLSVRKILRAVDIFAESVSPGLLKGADDPACVREITFTGGEPLLRFDALQAALPRIKSRYKWLKTTVFTNGVLLTPEKAGFLQRHGARIIVSLDGGKALNDRQRVLPGGSAFETVISNLRALPDKQRAGIHLMATFSSDTVGSVVETVRLFKTLGCRDIHLGLDIYETWRPAGLRRLERALAGLRKFSMRDVPSLLCASGRWNFDFYFKDKISAAQTSAPSHSFTLSPDGVFYPCDELCVARAERSKYSVGDLDSGLDFRKLEAVYDRASAYISRYDSVNGALSPIDRYYHALLSGKDPGPFLKNSAGVTAVFLKELGGLIDIERIVKQLAREPGFGDFAHDPKSRSSKEIKLLRLQSPLNGAARDWTLGSARNTIDFFLYSPGDRKKLILAAGAPVFDDAAQKLAFYSVLKARALRKNLEVIMEPERAPAEAQRRFFESHMVRVGVKNMKFKGPGFSSGGKAAAGLYGRICVDAGNISKIRSVMEHERKAGASWFKIEARLSGWGKDAPAVVAGHFRRIGAYIVKSVLAGRPVYLMNLAEVRAETPEMCCPLFARMLKADFGGRFFLGPPGVPLAAGCLPQIGSVADGLREPYASCAWNPSGESCRACLSRSKPVLLRTPGLKAAAELERQSAALLENMEYLAGKRRVFRIYLEKIYAERSGKSEFFGGVCG